MSKIACLSYQMSNLPHIIVESVYSSTLYTYSAPVAGRFMIKGLGSSHRGQTGASLYPR